MRALAYAVAAIAAVGIMIAIAAMPGGSDTNATNPQATAVSASTMQQPGTLTLSVPEMNCEFACFPKVKETLEKTAAVKEVELAPQAEEGVIDNRQVIVKYDAGFDVSTALTMLEKQGFGDSQVVQ